LADLAVVRARLTGRGARARLFPGDKVARLSAVHSAVLLSVESGVPPGTRPPRALRAQEEYWLTALVRSVEAGVAWNKSEEWLASDRAIRRVSRIEKTVKGQVVDGLLQGSEVNEKLGVGLEDAKARTVADTSRGISAGSRDGVPASR
jgi:hypothetical protein